MPKRPSARLAATSSDVSPAYASSKSWMMAAPFIATAARMPRCIRSMINGPRPTLIGCAPIPSTMRFPARCRAAICPRHGAQVPGGKDVGKAGKEVGEPHAGPRRRRDQRRPDDAPARPQRVGADLGEVERLGGAALGHVRASARVMPDGRARDGRWRMRCSGPDHDMKACRLLIVPLPACLPAPVFIAADGAGRGPAMLSRRNLIFRPRTVCASTSSQMTWPARMWVSWMRAVSVVRRGAQHQVGDPRELAAAAAGERDGMHADAFAHGDGAQNVCRLPAGGDRQGHVARPPEGANLLGEHLDVPVVVGDAGECRGVGRQRDRRQRHAFDLEAIDELGGDVLGVGSTAAVAEEQQLVPVA